MDIMTISRPKLITHYDSVNHLWIESDTITVIVMYYFGANECFFFDFFTVIV